MARQWEDEMLKTVVVAGIVSLVAMSYGHAQGYPTKQVTIITPGTPGSASDLMPRVIAEELAPRLGKSVVVENRSGGSGLVSANSALGQPADGHTLWFGTMGTLTINPFVMDDMPFDSLKAWTPIAEAGSMPLVLVVNPEKTPVKDLAGLIKYAKENPGKVTFGSAGIGSSYAITMFILGKQAGVDFTHVPYKGTAPAVSDVQAGELTAMVPDVGLVRSQIESGKLRALAVTTAKRLDMFPDVPTFKESGYDIEVSLWYGFFVRSNTPASISKRLVEDLKIAIQSASVKKRYEPWALIVGDKFGDDFARYVKSEYDRWGALVKPLNIRAN
jgi:tripartite-type tricarboxylate transporter receptor subunit TctC